MVYASTFSRTERDSSTGAETERKIPFLKSYTILNVEQTEGLPATMYAVLEPKPIDDAIEDVQVFIERIGATVRHGGDRAFYAPSLDLTQLPEAACFEGAGHYYL